MSLGEKAYQMKGQRKKEKLMKKAVSIILSLAMAMGSFAGCSSGGSSSAAATGSTGAAASTGSADAVKIAVAGPLTGDNAEYGNGFKNAVEMMVAKYNADGGVLGKKIEVIAYDDKGTGEEAATVAQKIASDKSIVGVIGHFSSGACMAATPTYQENSIINISPSASHPDYTKGGSFIFRNNTVITTEAGEAVGLAIDKLGKKKIGMIAIKTDWGISTEKVVKKILEDKASQGVQLVDTEEVVEGSDDYTPNVSKLKSAGAEAIICCSMYNTLAPFAKQYKQVNPDIQIVGFSNAYSEQLIKLGGSAVEGVVFPTIFFHQSKEEKVAKFVSDYKSKYNSVPSSLTAQAYDSAGILIEAVKKVGSLDRNKIREAVGQSNYDGVTGPTKFDENRNAVKVFKHAKVSNGQFVQID